MRQSKQNKLTSYYDILDVKPDATDEDIRRSYRLLALKFHPDRNTRNKSMAAHRFQLIAEAYNNLKTSGKRYTYNRWLLQNHGPHSPANSNKKSFIENIAKMVKTHEETRS